MEVLNKWNSLNPHIKASLYTIAFIAFIALIGLYPIVIVFIGGLIVLIGVYGFFLDAAGGIK